MIYRTQIIHGLRFLRRVQNTDGGIPATKAGVVSGCWTSAETLETLLASPYHDADPRPFAADLISFLKKTQFPNGEHRGGWPLVVGAGRASTMATGHAVAALALTQQYYREYTNFSSELTVVIDQGFDWLARTKNTDGGWGVEPAGGTDGSISRMIGTYYALRPYFVASKTVDNSKIVRDATEWVRGLANADGGFGGKFRTASDACDTARAVSIFLRSNYSKTDDKLIRRAIKFIVSSRPRSMLWSLDTETYVTEGAPGQTVYNSNTTSDVLEALVRAKVFDRHVEDLLDWYIKTQEEDGSWFLGANKEFVREIVTWSTNEAIYPISLAASAYVERKLPLVQRDAKVFRRISIALGLIALVELLYVIQLPVTITTAWEKIPETIRMVITQGAILALVVNLVSSFLYDAGKLFTQRTASSDNGQSK